MINYKNILVLILIFLVSSSKIVKEITNSNSSIKLLSEKEYHIAGDSISIKFLFNNKVLPSLYCSGSYGTTILEPTSNNDTLIYQIPKIISQKTGVVNWRLIHKKNNLKGTLNILPKNNIENLETYIGPPTIIAGGEDNAMAVIIPTDVFDNPSMNNTIVTIKHQFLDNEIEDILLTDNLIAFKRIKSSKQTGRILISSEALNQNSKEFYIDVLSGLPIDFKISALRSHHYADGNQITTFITSQLIDKYGNVVDDGTYIDFVIKTKDSSILKIAGLTLNGIAKAKMIHPETQSTWNVRGFIYGIAESNNLILDYKSAVDDFKIKFSKNNREIIVGPLQGFMNQRIPNGLQINLRVYQNKILINEESNYSVDGMVMFNLREDIYKGGIYQIEINAAGITKKHENIKL